MAKVIQFLLKVDDQGSKALEDVSGAATDADDNLEDLSDTTVEAEASMKGLAAAAVAGVAAFAAIGKAIFDVAAFTSTFVDDTIILSRSLGLTAEDTIALDRALQGSGSSIDKVSFGIRSLVARMGEASSGSAAAADAFGALGVSVVGATRELRDTGDVLRDTLNAIGQLPTDTQQAAAAIKIFGSRGTELVAALGGSSAAIDDWADTVAAAGLVIGEDAAQASAAFDESLTRLGITVDAIKLKLGTEFTPTVVASTSALEDFAVVAGSVAEDVVAFGRAESGVVEGMSNFELLITSRFPALVALRNLLGETADEMRDLASEAQGFDMAADIAASLEGDATGTGALLMFDGGAGGGEDSPARKAADTSREIERLVAQIERMAGVSSADPIGPLVQRVSDLSTSGKIAADEADRLLGLLGEVSRVSAFEEALAEASAEFEAMTQPMPAAASDLAAFESRMAALGVTFGGVLSPLDELRTLQADLNAAFERGTLSVEEYEAALAAVGAQADAVQSAGAVGTATDVVQGVTSGPSGVVGMLGNLGPIGQLVAAIVGAIDSIGKGLLDELHGFVMGLMDTIAELPGTIGRFIQTSVSEGIPRLIQMVPEFVDSLVTELVPALTEQFSDVGFAVELIEGLAVALFSVLRSLLVDAPAAIWQGISDWWGGIGGFQGIIESISDWWNNTVGGWSGVGDAIADWWSGVWESVQGFFRDLFGLDGGPATDFDDDGRGAFQEVVDFFRTGESFAKGGMVSETQLALVHAGERIVRPGGRADQTTGAMMGGAGGGVTLNLTVNGIMDNNVLDSLVRELEIRFGSGGLRTSTVLAG